MRRTVITCDCCEKDLTTSKDFIGYRLALTNEPMPCNYPAPLVWYVERGFDQDKHFCAIGCLLMWGANQDFFIKRIDVG